MPHGRGQIFFSIHTNSKFKEYCIGSEWYYSQNRSKGSTAYGPTTISVDGIKIQTCEAYFGLQTTMCPGPFVGNYTLEPTLGYILRQLGV